jgi:hypothetical protein
MSLSDQTNDTVEVTLADGRPHRLRRPRRAFYPIVGEGGSIEIGVAYELPGLDADCSDALDEAIRGIATAGNDREFYVNLWSAVTPMLRSGEPGLSDARVAKLLVVRPDDETSQRMILSLCRVAQGLDPDPEAAPETPATRSEAVCS